MTANLFPWSNPHQPGLCAGFSFWWRWHSQHLPTSRQAESSRFKRDLCSSSTSHTSSSSTCFAGAVSMRYPWNRAFLAVWWTRLVDSRLTPKPASRPMVTAHGYSSWLQPRSALAQALLQAVVTALKQRNSTFAPVFTAVFTRNWAFAGAAGQC